MAGQELRRHGEALVRGSLDRCQQHPEEGEHGHERQQEEQGVPEHVLDPALMLRTRPAHRGGIHLEHAADTPAPPRAREPAPARSRTKA